MKKKSQGSVPLRREVHDRLDADLKALLTKLQSNYPHKDVSDEAERILDDFTHSEEMPLRTGEKLLGPDWKRVWQASTDDWLAHALFGDISRDKTAKRLYVVVREMAGFVHDSQSLYDKTQNRMTLGAALRRYLSHRGHKVKLAQRDANAAYPNPRTYARDQWIYNHIHQNDYPALSLKLKKKAKAEKWQLISSRNGLKKAADRYAAFHQKDRRRFKVD